MWDSDESAVHQNQQLVDILYWERVVSIFKNIYVVCRFSWKQAVVDTELVVVLMQALTLCADTSLCPRLHVSFSMRSNLSRIHLNFRYRDVSSPFSVRECKSPL